LSDSQGDDSSTSSFFPEESQAQMSVEPKVRVLIADDHPVFTAGLRMLLESLPTTEVVGEASTGKDALELARELIPDIVMMDVDMPQMNGIAATQAILAASPDSAVLILSIIEDLDTVLAAVRAGARGYLLKGAGMEEIAQAIGVISKGGAIFGCQVAQAVVDYITKPPPQIVPFPELTDRERDVLRLVADGQGNTVIARELSLSVKTVRNYLSRIFAKLQVTHRTEAAVRARREGLVAEVDGKGSGIYGSTCRAGPDAAPGPPASPSSAPAGPWSEDEGRRRGTASMCRRGAVAGATGIPAPGTRGSPTAQASCK
jgi:DNA-binding NarL/FixJ family response regulator